MGMYDTFRMPSITFPDGKVYGGEFQSKDFGCGMDQYMVTSDGRVQKKEFEDDLIYQPCCLTASGWLYGEVDAVAVFAHGRLVSLEMKE